MYLDVPIMKEIYDTLLENGYEKDFDEFVIQASRHYEKAKEIYQSDSVRGYVEDKHVILLDRFLNQLTKHTKDDDVSYGLFCYCSCEN